MVLAILSLECRFLVALQSFVLLKPRSHYSTQMRQWLDKEKPTEVGSSLQHRDKVNYFFLELALATKYTPAISRLT